MTNEQCGVKKAKSALKALAAKVTKSKEAAGADVQESGASQSEKSESGSFSSMEVDAQPAASSRKMSRLGKKESGSGSASSMEVDAPPAASSRIYI